MDDAPAAAQRQGPFGTQGVAYRKLHIVGGFFDEPVTPEEKALAELQVEAGITAAHVARVVAGEPYISVRGGRTCITYSVLIDLHTRPSVVLDWAHTGHRWVLPTERVDFGMLPDLPLDPPQLIVVRVWPR